MSEHFIAININGTDRICKPLGLDKLAKSWSKQDDKAYYREELTGNLVFTGADFEALNVIEQSAARCTPLPFRIFIQCGTEWPLWYLGQLLLSEGDWWLDNCQLEIKASRLDPYNVLEQNKDEKRDIMQMGLTSYLAKIEIEGEFEYLECTLDYDQNHVSKGPIFCGAGFPGVGAWSWFYNYYNDDPSNQVLGPKQNPVNVTKWVRRKLTESSSLPIRTDWIVLSDDGTNRTYIKTATLFGYSATTGTDQWDHYETYQILGADSKNTDFDNGYYMRDVLFALLNEYYPGVILVSDFFQINPVNISQVNYVTGEQTEVDKLLIYQKSDIKRPGAAQNATKAELTLEQLLNALEILFNVRYKFINNSTFRIEHISWWQKNLGLNLTTFRYTKFVAGKRRYSYDKGRLPKYEEFKTNGDRYPDFKGLPITYNSFCVNQEPKSNKQTYSVDAFITDFEGVLREETDTEDLEGLVMVATKEQAGVIYIRQQPGILETASRINNVLSWANLHKNYYLHDRILYTGELNGQATTFKSIKRSKKGVRLAVPLRCTDVFAPEDLVLTALGTGEVAAAKENLISGMLELELLYDTEPEPTGNVAPIAIDNNYNVDYNTATVLDIAANDTDANGDLLPCQLIITAQPSYGTISNLTNQGQATYAPGANFQGSDSFKYRIADSTGLLSNEATVFIQVSIPDTAPVANNDSYYTNRNTVLAVPATMGVLINDTNWAGAGSFSVTGFSAATTQGGTVSVNANGSFNYTPPTGFTGTDGFTYTITSNTGKTATATVLVDVRAPYSAVYVTIHLQNITVTHSGNITTTKADLILSFFTDSTQTQPTAVSGLIVNYNAIFNENGNEHSNARTIQCNGTEQVVFTQQIIGYQDSSTNYKYNYVYRLLPGNGYQY